MIDACVRARSTQLHLLQAQLGPHSDQNQTRLKIPHSPMAAGSSCSLAYDHANMLLSSNCPPVERSAILVDLADPDSQHQLLHEGAVKGGRSSDIQAVFGRHAQHINLCSKATARVR